MLRSCCALCGAGINANSKETNQQPEKQPFMVKTTDEQRQAASGCPQATHVAALIF